MCGGVVILNNGVMWEDLSICFKSKSVYVRFIWLPCQMFSTFNKIGKKEEGRLHNLSLFQNLCRNLESHIC